jgi:hypothetical protein
MNAALGDAEASHLAEMERRAKARPRGERDGEGERFLHPSREVVVTECAPGGAPHVREIAGIDGEQAEGDRHVATLVERADVRERRRGFRRHRHLVGVGDRDTERAGVSEPVGDDVERVGDPDHHRRLVPEGIALHPLQLPGCSVRADSVVTRVHAAHDGGDHLLLATGELPGAIARFMARPCGPPNWGSHAITRLIAGGSQSRD